MRRLKEREKEREADARDRQREKEELEEIKRKLMEDGHPDPEAELEKVSIMKDFKANYISDVSFVNKYSYLSNRNSILVLHILLFQNLAGGGKKKENKMWEFQPFNNLCVVHFTKFNFNLK